MRLKAQLQRARRRRPLPVEENRQLQRGERAAVPKPKKPLASKEDDVVSGTVARLREIGVSFISPEEMRYVPFIRCYTFVGKRNFSLSCGSLSMQVFSAAAPSRNQHPLPSPPEGGRRMPVDQLESGHQLRGAEEPRRPTADADGEETAARAADGGGRAGRRHAADRRREEQTSRAGLWIRRMLVLDQASSHGCSHCSLTSLDLLFLF